MSDQLFSVENKICIVTGGLGQIGKNFVQELWKRGARVAVWGRTVNDERIAKTLGEEALKTSALRFYSVDITKKEEMNAALDDMEAVWGDAPDVLVNNAGIAGQIQFQDITDAQWNRYLGVNLGGARNTIQAVLPHMLHEKAGCIVNISSIWGLRGASCEVAYACTKAALVGLTRSLALELAPSHIRVNCVAPGVINTDMVQVLGQETLRDLAEQTPLGRLGTPEDVAHAVAFLASDKASFLTGQILAADGGFIV